MQTPELKQLMAGYFHQDFMEVHGGVWETVEAFLRADPERAADLVGEIDLVLKELPTEAGVELYLDELGCEYWPPPEEGGYREWLSEIARRVAAATS